MNQPTDINFHQSLILILRQITIELRCGAVTVGFVYLFPPLSSGEGRGASVPE